MRLSKAIKMTLAALAVGVMGLGIVKTASAQTGTYTGNGKPQFNIYKDVPGIGDEADFVRTAPSTATDLSQYSNDTQACEGDVNVWLYMHNGAPEAYNNADQNFSGIARNTSVKISLGTGASNAHAVTGIISADNAVPTSVSNGAAVSCGTDQTTLEFVSGSARFRTEGNATYPIGDNIVNGGALIGSVAGDGNFPGCWNFRGNVRITVRIKKVAKPVVKASCDSLVGTSYSVKENDPIEFVANATAQNTTITGYRFLLNGAVVQDGASAKYSFKQAKAGTYELSVTVSFANGSSSSGTECFKKVVVTTTPVTPSAKCEKFLVTTVDHTINTQLTYTSTDSTRVVLKNVSYNFDDGTTAVTVSNTNSVSHVFTKNGDFKVTADITVTIDGKDVVIPAGSVCTAPVHTGTTTTVNYCVINGVTYSILADDAKCKPCTALPSVLDSDARCPHVKGITTVTTLPNTGSGNVTLVFLAVVLAAAAAHSVYTKRTALES